MSDLVVIGFDNEFKADALRLELVALQRESVIGLEDAVVAVKKPDGTVTLKQSYSLPTAGAVGGGFWGLLIGTLFLNPLLGAVAGAAAGAAAGALADIGIDDDFMRELAAALEPGRSALFILVPTAMPDTLLEVLRGAGGTVLKTSLSHTDATRLQAALDPTQERRGVA